MSIVIVLSQNARDGKRHLTVGRSSGAAGRISRARGTPFGPARYTATILSDGDSFVNEAKKGKRHVHSGDPNREHERKLKRNPQDQDAKVDVGSDESMDASDPPATAQPGQKDEPVPSSGFPE
jgi:hypothetical protein